MANVPRKHHYVPKVLLAGFTSTGRNNGKLHIVDLVRGTTYPSTPEEAGKARDYNLIEGPDPFAIESGLFANDIEGPAGPAFETVRSGGVPSEDNQIHLLSFMAMQWLRGPSLRDADDDFTTQVMRRIVDAYASNPEMFEAEKRKHPEHLMDVTPEILREWASHTTMTHSPTAYLQAQLPAHGPILDLLVGRSWLVLDAPATAEFVCTDEPVVLFSTGARPMGAPLGFGHADAAVFMPLGRGHALLGRWPTDEGPLTWSMAHADSEMVATMNRHLLDHAHRFVASASDDFAWLCDGALANRAEFIEVLKKALAAPTRDA